MNDRMPNFFFLKNQWRFALSILVFFVEYGKLILKFVGKCNRNQREPRKWHWNAVCGGSALLSAGQAAMQKDPSSQSHSFQWNKKCTGKGKTIEHFLTKKILKREHFHNFRRDRFLKTRHKKILKPKRLKDILLKFGISVHQKHHKEKENSEEDKNVYKKYNRMIRIKNTS